MDDNFVKKYIPAYLIVLDSLVFTMILIIQILDEVI